MNLVSSTEQDIPKLADWISQDLYHQQDMPVWWITGNGLLSYRIEDSEGITMYVRLDSDNGLMRINIQFAPDSEVSKPRVIKSFIWALPKMVPVGKMFNLTGFIFKSKSPLLISFVQKQFGFTSVGNDDYVKPFEEGV